ncbi:cobalamin biosynthesis protein [Actinomycetospora sp. NBRC 106375]|uniref:CobW family GTP-binding protein n=1 Tax=Actinomycetospora sp. NBRC 106375 TaxID=3032207 RepID=UPI0024A1452F|nr:GTP-binding protein [Actinomycetospora sp. NBRC 106375]GLZ48749.1 cobalamin biosynthesis protein [Actinomycetospora sp. NBRC 106375]
MPRRVPVVLVAGHLGAGKSTLVNHLLRHADGVRIGVVVNDFGAIGIDAMLVAGQASAVTSLADGCLCCTTDANGLAALLAELTAPAARLDLVVVEASGIAEPRELVRLLLDAIAGDARHAEYGGLVAVVDAADGRTDDAVRLADLVVVNQVDRVDDPTALLTSVRAVAAGPALPVVRGAVDPALLVDPPARRAPRRTGQLSFDVLLREDAAGAHTHANWDSVAVDRDAPLDPARFAAFLEAGPAGVFRSKGVVRFPGAAPFVVQTVGTAIRVRPAPRSAAVAGARLVFLGVGLDAGALHAALDACAADPAAPEPSLLPVLRYEESDRVDAG